MLAIFDNYAYNHAPATQVANWIATDLLRHVNIDERPILCIKDTI